MEIPTMLLALGSLNPRWRSDYLFAGAFLGTRIMLHIALIAAYAGVYFLKANVISGNPEATGANSTSSLVPNRTLYGVQQAQAPKSLNSPLPTLFFLAALPMHCMWFMGCIRGMVRRRAKANSTKADVPVVLVSTSTSTFRTRFQAIRGRLRLDQESRERLRARVQAAYGNARGRVWGRGIRAEQVVFTYSAPAETQAS